MSIAGVVLIFLAFLALVASLKYAETITRWDEEINGEARRESEQRRNR